MGKIYSLAPRVEFTPLSTGEYVLTLLEWKEITEEKDTQYHKRGDVRLQFQWRVDVPGGDSEERRDWADIPQTFSAKSKFVKIAVALGIVDEASAIAEGCEVDFDCGLGKRCIASILRKRKDGTNEWTDQIVSYARMTRAPQPPARARLERVPEPQFAHDDDVPF